MTNINRIKKLTLFIILLFCSCVSKKMSNDWSKDQNGCLQLRSRDLADKLVKQNGLMNDAENNFLKVFGNPDTISQTKETEILIYYINSMCENNKPVKESDKCWAEFYFESGRLKSYNFPCE